MKLASTSAAIFYNSMGSRHPWCTSKRVKGSDRRAFILNLDLILVYATLIIWINFSSYPNLFKSENIKSTLTLFRMCFFGPVHGWGVKVGGGGGWSSHTYPTVMKRGTVIPYLKMIQKIYESCDKPREFCRDQHFFTGNQQILLYQEIQI